MTIEIPEELETGLAKIAEAKGIPLEDYLRSLLQQEVESQQVSGPPLKSYFGVLAKYGAAPSAEEIDENRREIFQNFASDDE